MAFVGRLLLPVLLTAAAIYFLYHARGTGSFLAYFLPAVLLGMAIAGVQWAWRGRNDD